MSSSEDNSKASEQFTCTESSDFVCSICLGIPKSGHCVEASCCGHFFCDNCVAGLDKCPVCRKLGRTLFGPASRFAERKLLGLKLRCDTNPLGQNEGGCPWIGEWRDLDQHVQFCAFVTEKCANVGCSELVTRKDKDQHASTCPFGLAPCAMCGMSVQRKDQERHSRDECPETEIECPHGHDKCAKFPRKALKIHFESVCQFNIEPCPFAEEGCPAKLGKSDLQVHLLTHMSSLVRTVKDLQNEVTSLKKQLADVQSNKQQQQGSLSRSSFSSTDVSPLFAFPSLPVAKSGSISEQAGSFFTGRFGRSITVENNIARCSNGPSLVFFDPIILRGGGGGDASAAGVHKWVLTVSGNGCCLIGALEEQYGPLDTYPNRDYSAGHFLASKVTSLTHETPRFDLSLGEKLTVTCDLSQSTLTVLNQKLGATARLSIAQVFPRMRIGMILFAGTRVEILSHSCSAFGASSPVSPVLSGPSEFKLEHVYKFGRWCFYLSSNYDTYFWYVEENGAFRKAAEIVNGSNGWWRFTSATPDSDVVVWANGTTSPQRLTRYPWTLKPGAHAGAPTFVPENFPASSFEKAMVRFEKVGNEMRAVWQKVPNQFIEVSPMEPELRLNIGGEKVTF